MLANPGLHEVVVVGRDASLFRTRKGTAYGDGSQIPEIADVLYRQVLESPLLLVPDILERDIRHLYSYILGLSLYSMDMVVLDAAPRGRLRRLTEQNKTEVERLANLLVDRFG